MNFSYFVRCSLFVSLLGLGIVAFVPSQVEANDDAYSPDYTKFNGVYAGVQGGYSSGGIQIVEPRIGGIDVGIDGFFGGAHAGYGYAVLDRVYVGAEAEYNIHDNSISDAFIAEFTTEHSYSASVRLGFLASEDAMVYTKAGYHNAKISANGESNEAKGARFGAGVEYIVWDSISVRGEALYAHYFVGDDLKPVEEAYDASLILGVSYRF